MKKFCSSSKFESVRNKVRDFLEENKLITESQCGFHNKKSWLANLIEFYEDTVQHLDIGESVDAKYLYFGKVM